MIFYGKSLKQFYHVYIFFQIHKKLGNTHLALMYFSWATDLDPKGVNSQIKEAIMSPGQGEDESLVAQTGIP